MRSNLILESYNASTIGGLVISRFHVSALLLLLNSNFFVIEQGWHCSNAKYVHAILSCCFHKTSRTWQKICNDYKI